MRHGVARALAWLPRGNTLPSETWATRHAGLRWLLWAQFPALVGLEAILGQQGRYPIGLFLVPVGVLGAVSGWSAVPRRLQSVAVSLGLLAAAALAVNATDGLTEMHFVFFVFVIALSLYEDWLILGVAIGFVVLEHALAPQIGLHVYHHAGSAWPWAGIHGAFVLAVAAICVVSWRLSEQVRAELVVAEGQMRDAQKLESLGLLAGGVAHDFNNLLMGVMGNASLALAQLPEGSPLRKYLDGIELAGTRATELTRQMLAYAGSGKLAVDEVSVSRLVGDMAHLLDAGISKNATLELRLGDAVGTVRGDPGQLAQVVMNLITNAAESLGDEPGTVVVSTSAASAHDLAESGAVGLDSSESYVMVEVADSGTGMDDETKEKMFEPFFTTKFTGRGLGLAGVSGIVRSHRGHIHVTSTLGRGSTFRVFLPNSLTAAHRPDAPSVARRTRESYTGHALVVDDERIVREVVSAALRQTGLDVVSVAGGAEAIEHLGAATRPFRLAVIDMTMPGLDGLETTRSLREIQADLPVILSSGYSVDPVDRLGFEDVSFLQKPYDLAKLLDLVGEAVDR
jgi:two-component system cell cycle sensor histidine kinase/response regulator CckA